MDILGRIRRSGYALVEEDSEVGMCLIAVPVRGASGNVIAALNIGAQATRVGAKNEGRVSAGAAALTGRSRGAHQPGRARFSALTPGRGTVKLRSLHYADRRSA